MADVLRQLQQLVSLRERRLERARQAVRLARQQLEHCQQQRAQCESERQRVEQQRHQVRLDKVQGAFCHPRGWLLLEAQEAMLKQQADSLQARARQLDQANHEAREQLQFVVAEQQRQQQKIQALTVRVGDIKRDIRQRQQQKEQRRMDEISTGIRGGQS